MVKIKQFPDSVIANWRTGSLGGLYMNSFIASRKYDSECSQLERITAILAKRDIGERAAVAFHFKAALKAYVAKEDYENASLFRDMILHYNLHVLG